MSCAERISTTSEARTTPPPGGSKDMYSAPTRVGTLPENVLAVMRDRQAPDEELVSTRYVRPFVPPPLASAPETRPPMPSPSTWMAPLPTPAPIPVVVMSPRRSRFAQVMWSFLAIMAFAILGAAVAILVVAR